MSDDERAIITLYTIEMDPPEESLYYVLNEALRARDRQTPLDLAIIFGHSEVAQILEAAVSRLQRWETSSQLLGWGWLLFVTPSKARRR
eukprot:Skav220574  [mRNA]  locus=scaffold145:146620:152958:- [translate_table: standard]